jgi:hypothetical protein
MAGHGSGSRDRTRSWRDGTWPPISTRTAVRKGAAKEAGDPGNDELATTGYGHGIRL